jgi:AraC-like DNA-binding protein
MKIKFGNYDAKDWLEQLAGVFKCDVEQDCQEYTLQIPKGMGEGTFKSYCFRDGISLFLINCRLNDALQITIESGDPHPLHFNFCTEGAFRHTLGEQDTTYQLNPFSGSITANPNHARQTFFFPKASSILHTNLQILRKDYIHKTDCDLEKMPPRLARAFGDVESKEFFLYESNYSVPTADCIQQLAENSYQGLVKTSYCEAKALELLSLQLKQFADDLTPGKQFKTLKQYDIQKIKEARKILTSDLTNAPTIMELSRLSGINQQKLKKGFKQIYGTTISRYLRNARMEAAKYLLMEGRLSIGEIAQQVGYSNQSHFARRFKETYGATPREAMAQYSMLNTDFSNLK